MANSSTSLAGERVVTLVVTASVTFIAIVAVTFMCRGNYSGTAGQRAMATALVFNRPLGPAHRQASGRGGAGLSGVGGLSCRPEKPSTAVESSALTGAVAAANSSSTWLMSSRMSVGLGAEVVVGDPSAVTGARPLRPA